MGPEKRIKLAVGLVLFFLGTGTVGYSYIDGYTFLDAFYMTVITITTVGYGEIQQLSEAGRIFTIFLILSGVGSIAFAAGAFTELIIERSAHPNRWKRAMEKKIGKLKDHVIICGHGRVGAAAAEHFIKNKAPFVVIENSPEILKELQDLGYHFVQGDGTREEVLQRAGIKRASSLLAVLNSDPDNLFAVLTARELNPVLRIIARIEHSTSESRMMRAGADSIISPFVAAGQRVAENLLAKGKAVGGDLDGSERRVQKTEWLEVSDQSELGGKSVEVAGERMDGRIVGIRRKTGDILMPEGNTILQVGDHLLLLHYAVDVHSAVVTVQPRKIVFIDDNPVILRLYTRLFQKAGFNIMCASTGQEGYDLVVREMPDGVVVDFHLPDVTGLAICEKIKALPGSEKIKLFLFTADDQEDTRKMALAAGVNKVVVKSPDAGEIVSLVSEQLQ
ncbi:MAG: NAD-binding protein [Desulforhopalus sp.]